MTWQPIETAPDREPVLCAIKHGIGLVIAHRAGDEIYGDSGNDWTGSVTHWMPLPPAPDAAP